MNKKLFSILTACLLGCIVLPAAPVDEDAARDIAAQFAARPGKEVLIECRISGMI